MKWAKNLRKASRNKNISKFPSSKMGKTMMCESPNENDCAHWLEYASNIPSYDDHPPSYTYEINGKEHSYTPDFILTDSSNNTTYVEVKPINFIADEEFRIAHQAMQESAVKLGYNLILITDKQLQSGFYLKNSKLICDYDGQFGNNDNVKKIRNAISRQERVTSQELSERSNISTNEVFAAVLELIAKRELGADLFSAELNENSIVWKGASLPIQFKDDFQDISYLNLDPNDFLDNQKKLRNQSLENTKLIEPDLTIYSEAQQIEAIERHKLLCLILNELEGGWTPKNLNPLIDKFIIQTQLKKPSYKTVIRWHKAFLSSDGKITSLISKHGNKGSKERKVVEDERYFEEAVEQYLIAEKPTINAAYTYYKSLIIAANENVVVGQIPIVSYKTFRQRILNLPPYEVKKAKSGKYLADKEFGYTDSIKMPTRILERVEIDHSPLDLILLDDEYEYPLGRAYLTLVVDVYSGCIIGFHLGFESPSYDSVAKALIHSVKKKDYVKKLPITLHNDWHCHGKIKTLVVDNGAEFLSKSLEKACLSSGIKINQNKVRRPWMKPFVERMFKTAVQGIVGWIPGKTFSNILEKEDYDPKKDAVMRFSVFIQEFHRWIIDVHNANADTRNKRIPNLFWTQSYAKLPTKEVTPEQEKSFVVSMGLYHEGTLTKRGIQYRHLTYDSKALAEYRAKYPQTKESRKKTIKIDPDNLASIYIYLEELGGYIEIPCRDNIGYTDKLCLSLHKKIVKAHAKYIQGNINILTLAKARLALHEAIKKERENSGKQQKKTRISDAKKIAQAKQVNSKTAIENLTTTNSPAQIKPAAIIDKHPIAQKAETLQERWERIKKESEI